jgi:hypothetical protein
MERPTNRITLEAFGFYALLLLVALAPWFTGLLPENDGYNHVTNAKLIVDLLTGQCPLAAEFFRFNPHLVPNWSGHAVMAALIYGGTSFLQAELVVISLCIALPALTFRYLLKVAKTDIAYSWAALALCVNSYIWHGLYNFTLGVAFGFFAVALYLKQSGRMRHPPTLIAFSLTLLAAWFSHILAFLCAGLFIFICECRRLYQLYETEGMAYALRDYLRESIFFLAALIPGLGLCLIFFLTPSTGYTLGAAQPSLLGKFVQDLLMFVTMHDFSSSMVGYKEIRSAAAILLSILLLNMAAFHVIISKKHETAKFFMPALVCAITLMILSTIIDRFSVKGGWMIDWRLRGMAWYFIIFAASHLALNRYMRSALMLVCTFLTCFHVFWLYKVAEFKIARAEPVLAQSLPTPDNSLIYTIDLSNNMTFNTLTHILLNNRKCIINLMNNEAQFDYFPIRFKDHITHHLLKLTPVRIAEKGIDIVVSTQMKDFDLTAFEKQTGRKIDTIFVWGDTETLKGFAHDSGEEAFPSYVENNLPYLQKHLFTDYLGKRQIIYKNGNYLTIYR